MSIEYNLIDTYQTRMFQSFINLTELDRTTWPAITTVNIDTENPTLTCYNIYDQWALRGKGSTIPPSPTPTPSITPTISLTPSETPEPTPTPDVTSTPTSSPTPEVTPSLTPSITPSNTSTSIISGQTLHLYLDAANPGSYSGSGTAWNDLSVHNNDGVLVGSPTFNSTYFSFDGSSTQYVDLNTALDFESFAVGAWVRTSASGIRMILSKETPAGAPWNYRLWLNDGQIIGDIAKNGSPFTTISSPLTYNDGNWYLIMFTRDVSTKNLTINVNGSQVATLTDLINGSIKNNQELWIGRSAYSGAYQFQGDIGEVFVYDKELTNSEMLQNFIATKGGYGY